MEERAVDTSSWDGNQAMGQCSTASQYHSICAGEKSVGSPDERQHWALPHHYLGKGPNADGVRNALSRLPQTQGLTNKAAAQSHLEDHMSAISPDSQSSLPADGLVRSTAYELRQSEDESLTMVGHFARFNEWTEINSIFEGHFMERVAPGAFTRTFAEDRNDMKVTFNHGKGPSGDLVLGPIADLREDDEGAYYEVPLFRSVDPLLVEGLQAGVYGASFRFHVTREQFDKRAQPSDYNPNGLPERTVQEVRVGEFGPVTFPAYAGATAGIRSLTDEFLTESQLEEFRALAEIVRSNRPDEEPGAGVDAPPEPGKAVTRRARKRKDYLTDERRPPWKL